MFWSAAWDGKKGRKKPEAGGGDHGRGGWTELDAITRVNIAVVRITSGPLPEKQRAQSDGFLPQVFSRNIGGVGRSKKWEEVRKWQRYRGKLYKALRWDINIQAPNTHLYALIKCLGQRWFHVESSNEYQPPAMRRLPIIAHKPCTT